MGMNDKTKSCVKCRKVLKSTEKVLVCGLWCRKSFHNDCVGLTNTATRIVTSSNERIKFHCETCENRLGIELVGEKETQNSVNSCLLELVQKILKLTNELSNNNSVINNKLDTVISSNTRLEEYILQSPKCLEKLSVETTDNSVDCVESFSARPTMEISEENDTNSDNPNLNSSSVPQQSDDNSSSLHIASDDPKHLSDDQEPLVAEGSSNSLQECEMRDDHSGTQDLPSTNNEECIPSEDFSTCNVFSIAKAEYVGAEEEEEEIEIDNEECSPSEDFIEGSTFSVEKIEHGVDGEPVREDIMEECSPSEDFIEGGTFSIEKIEHSVDGEPVREDIMEECSPSDDFIEGSTFSIEKIEHGVDGEPVRGDIVEERSPSGFINGSTFSIEKIAHGVDGEPVREDIMEELKPEVEPGATDNQPQSTIVIGTEDNRNNNDKNSLLTDVSHTPRKVHRFQRTINQEISCGNKSGTKCIQHSRKICKKVFANLEELKEHVSMSRCELRHLCIVCHKTFAYNRSLEKHIQMHTRERQKFCEICNKIFKYRSSLKKHLLLHSSERPYSCSICNKTFKLKYILQRHTLVHSGERPYNCSFCHKTFRHRTSLQQHLRLHSGERPYSCCVCSKTFRQLTHLQRHSLVHSGERPYSCRVLS